MPFPSYITAAGQNAFTTETRVSDYVITQALGANEPTALLISAKYWQTRANYARPAANTVLTYDNGAGADVTAYFIDDTEFTDQGGGVQEWTRTWATVPASWMEPGGTFAFTFPAYISPIAFGTLYSVTNANTNGNYYDLATNAANIAATDTFLLDLNYVRNSQNYHVTFQTDAKFAGTGTLVPIAKVLPGAGTFSGVTGTLQEVRIGRSLAETLEVDSYLIHDYALASETTADILLPQIDRFSPVNSSGYAVEALSTGTATTPNSATYGAMVAAGTLITARRSDRRKYAGNIWERTTLVVAAR
jgi:hypothetical protein